MAIKAEHVPGEANHFALNHEGRIAIAVARAAERGGKKTSAQPREVGGVIWTCWSTGILRSEWRATRNDGAALRVDRNHNRSTFSAQVNGAYVPGAGGKPKRFQTLGAAMRGAVEATL